MLRQTVKNCSRLRAPLYRTISSTRTVFNAKGGRSDGPESDKTPFQVFLDTFSKEWSKSKELQEQVKQLQDETGRMAESSTFKRAKEALDAAKTGSSATGEGLKKAGKVVGSAAGAAWDSSLVRHTRDAAAKAADNVDKATEPIRKTELYKNIKEVIDDGSSSRYGGYSEKEQRRLWRKLEEQKRLEEDLRKGIVRSKPVKANEDAGESVIVHETAKVEKDWNEEFAKTGLGKRLADLKIAYEESENGFISAIRGVTDTIGGFFAETEAARVVKLFREIDPSFNQEEFLKEFRGYILPEVLEAYVKGDQETLKMWLSEAPFNIWKTGAKQYIDQGLYSAGRILDIRGVDILQAKVLPPAEIPVYVIGCRAQEVHLFRNAKTGEIAAGTEDHIQQSVYAMVLTRIPEELDNPETKGWKILELRRGQTRDWT